MVFNNVDAKPIFNNVDLKINVKIKDLLSLRKYWYRQIDVMPASHTLMNVRNEPTICEYSKHK